MKPEKKQFYDRARKCYLDAVERIKSTFTGGGNDMIVLPEENCIECTVWSPYNGCYQMVIRAINFNGYAFMTDACVGDGFIPEIYDYVSDEGGIVTSMSYDKEEIDWESVCELADYLSGNTKGPQSLLEALQQIKKEADEYIDQLFLDEHTEFDINVSVDYVNSNADLVQSLFVKATEDYVLMDDGDCAAYNNFTIDSYLQIVDGINIAELVLLQ